VIEWDRGAGTDDWGTGGNWSGNAVPSSGKDVLFGNLPGGVGALFVAQDTANLAINSLWFETGRDYTLGGSGSLKIGAGLSDNGKLITVFDRGTGAWQSETRIDLDLQLDLAAGHTAEIANYSGSGLRLGGGLDFGQNHLRIRGGSAVHLAGVLSGAGNLTVATAAGHVVLSADNVATWTGAIEVKHGFLLVTENGALGAAASGPVVINGASSGATLAFRPSPLGVGVNYASTKSISVSGQGYARPWGSADPSDENAVLNLRPVGAIYNDGGDNRFAGEITLLGDTWFGSRAGELELSGAISDGGSGYALTKVGHGLIELSNAANAWGGVTTLKEGVLRISGATDLPTASALVLAGGTLELGAGDFGRVLGAAAGQVSWSGDGGFSAHGGARSVTLNGSDGNSLVLTWGGGGFVPAGSALLLGSAYADNATNFKNAINLGSELREVRVTRGVSAASIGELSGKLSGTAGGGILKTGNGSLWISNTANDYRGATRIEQGVLGGEIPSGANGSNIQFRGGVLGLLADFTRGLGTSGDQVRWLTRGSTDTALGAGYSGGFAAYGGDHTVTLNGSSSTWFSYGSEHFVKEKSYLIFGEPDSDGTVLFNSRLSFLPSVGNNIRVIAGTDLAKPVVVFQRAFRSGDGTSSQRARDLHFCGDGRADVITANPNFRTYYVGARGTDLRLRADGSFSQLQPNYPIEAWWGGSVTFDNTETYLESRIPTGSNVALYAGAFRYWGRAAGANQNSEASMNLFQLSLGANELEINNYNASKYSRLTFNFLKHISGISEIDDSGVDGHYHATVNFTSNSDFVSGSASGAQLRFKNQPFDLGGIMPYATVKGEDWAWTEKVGTGSSAYYYLKALISTYETGGPGNWSTAINAAPASNYTLSSNQNLNSLKLTSGRSIDLGGNLLRLDSGGVLSVGTDTTEITGGTLTTRALGQGGGARNNPLYVHVYNTAAVGLEISSAIDITGRNDRPAFVKTGPGTLLLSGNTSNTITGETYINQGVLALGKTGGATALGGTIIVGDQAGHDTLRLDRSEQIANNATVRLRGGHADPEYHLMAEGILQFNGAGGRGLRETFAKLEVEGRGVIDFGGGSVGHANYLILEDLDISSDTSYYRASKLFIRNWYEGEDFLLVSKKSANLLNSLSRIEFEGYGPAIVRNWNADYFLVTPMPEPATYGAILGAAGTGLFFLRRLRPSRTSPD